MKIETIVMIFLLYLFAITADGLVKRKSILEDKSINTLNCDSLIETPSILTGQGPIYSLDSSWQVTNAFGISMTHVPLSDLPTPDSPSLTWTYAPIIPRCAGVWVNPESLPYPLSQSNWITSQNNQTCNYGSTSRSYYYYKTELSLPCTCGGVSISIDSVYTISLDAYVDNRIVAAYVNDQFQNVQTLPGGSYSSSGGVQVELNSGWVPGTNTITFLIENLTGSASFNPVGFLAVLSQHADVDNDGVDDYLDLCLCAGHTIVDTIFISNSSCNLSDVGTTTNTLLTSYGCDSTTVTETLYSPELIEFIR